MLSSTQRAEIGTHVIHRGTTSFDPAIVRSSKRRVTSNEQTASYKRFMHGLMKSLAPSVRPHVNDSERLSRVHKKSERLIKKLDHIYCVLMEIAEMYDYDLGAISSFSMDE